MYSWLESHGEVFLRRNQSIGKNLMRAKMLHLSHENFVKVLKVKCISSVNFKAQVASKNKFTTRVVSRALVVLYEINS